MSSYLLVDVRPPIRGRFGFIIDVKVLRCLDLQGLNKRAGVLNCQVSHLDPEDLDALLVQILGIQIQVLAKVDDIIELLVGDSGRIRVPSPLVIPFSGVVVSGPALSVAVMKRPITVVEMPTHSQHGAAFLKGICRSRLQIIGNRDNLTGLLGSCDSSDHY